MASSAGTNSGSATSAAGGQPAKVGLSAVILAAGKGTRMQSDLPKVVHPVGGRAMVCAVIDACIEAGVDHIVVVVGYRKYDVIGALQPYLERTSFGPDTGNENPATRIKVEASERAPHVKVEITTQDPQFGTAHAVRCARGPFNYVVYGHLPRRDVFVLCGDGPLIRAATLRTMLERHRSTGASATLATSVIEDPTGYGRIVRDEAGRFQRIVEHKGATEAQRAIHEVNPSYYCFDVQTLFEAVERVPENEQTGEYYITDVFEMMMKDGKRVEVIDAVPPEDVLSINTPEQLAEVDRIFRSRRGTGLGSGVGEGVGGSSSGKGAGA